MPFRISILSRAATLALVTAASGGQNVYHSVQNGPWENPATWDVAVPGSGIGDRGVIGHVVGVTTSINPEDVEVGHPGVRGQLNVFNGSFTVDQTIRVGDTGVFEEPSEVILFGGTLETGALIVGDDGPALVQLLDGDFIAHDGLFVGTNGHDAELHIREFGTVTAGGGVTIGAHGALSFVYQLPPPPPIHVPTGNVTLEPGWSLPVDEFTARAFRIGDRIDLFTYVDGAVVADPAPSGHGLEFTIDDSVPGVLTLVVTRAAQMRWTNPGLGPWLDALNWDALLTPDAAAEPVIANGGTAQLVGGTADVTALYVGLFDGDGHLELENAALTVAHELNLAAPDSPHGWLQPAADITASLHATNSPITVGENFDIASTASLEAPGTSVNTATFSMTGGVLDVVGALRIASPDIAGDVHTLTETAHVTLRQLEYVQVGGDIDIADPEYFSDPDLVLDVTMEIDAIAHVHTVDDVEVAPLYGDGAGAQNATVALTVTHSVLEHGGAVDLASCRASADGRVRATVTVNVESCDWNAAERFRIARLIGGGGDATNVADASISFADSLVVAGALEVGVREEETPGTVRGRVELDRSMIDTDPTMTDVDGQIVARGGSLRLGAFAELRFVIAGDQRITPLTIGAPDQYAAIDITPSSAAEGGAIAQLGGRLELAFAHPSVTTGATFDVIRNLGDVPFTGAFDTIEVTGLSAGLDATVLVTTDADDHAVVRVVVVHACVGDVDGDGAVGFGDVLTILAAWGACSDCAADLDGSGSVDFADLLTALSAWGACP